MLVAVRFRDLFETRNRDEPVMDQNRQNFGCFRATRAIMFLALNATRKELSNSHYRWSSAKFEESRCVDLNHDNGEL